MQRGTTDRVYTSCEWWMLVMLVPVADEARERAQLMRVIGSL